MTTHEWHFIFPNISWIVLLINLTYCSFCECIKGIWNFSNACIESFPLIVDILKVVMLQWGCHYTALPLSENYDWIPYLCSTCLFLHKFINNWMRKIFRSSTKYYILKAVLPQNISFLKNDWKDIMRRFMTSLYMQFGRSWLPFIISIII